jgi:hypothetical protein
VLARAKFGTDEQYCCSTEQCSRPRDCGRPRGADVSLSSAFDRQRPTQAQPSCSIGRPLIVTMMLDEHGIVLSYIDRFLILKLPKT